MQSKTFYRVYGFGTCDWCHKAKDLLFMHALPYDDVDLDPIDVRKAWMDSRGFTGRDRTLPKVYLVDVKGVETLIGGYTDLAASLGEEA